jgi:hypothetical protein
MSTLPTLGLIATATARPGGAASDPAWGTIWGMIGIALGLVAFCGVLAATYAFVEVGRSMRGGVGVPPHLDDSYPAQEVPAVLRRLRRLYLKICVVCLGAVVVLIGAAGVLIWFLSRGWASVMDVGVVAVVGAAGTGLIVTEACLARYYTDRAIIRRRQERAQTSAPPP